MASLYHVLVLALGTASFTQGTPYGYGGYGSLGGNCGGGVNACNENALSEASLNCVDDYQSISNICEDQYLVDDNCCYFEEDALLESSENFAKTCDSTCVKKSICSEDSFGNFDNGYYNQGNMNSFDNNYMAGNSFGDQGMYGNGYGCGNGLGNYGGCGNNIGGFGGYGGYGNMGGCGCGGGYGGCGLNGGYGNGECNEFGAYGNDYMDQYSCGYNDNYGMGSYGQGSFGTRNYVEEEEVVTSCESECYDNHYIDSYSVIDEQSNFLNEGSSLVDDNCYSEYGAEQVYQVDECGSQCLNENMGCVGNNCYF